MPNNWIDELKPNDDIAIVTTGHGANREPTATIRKVLKVTKQQVHITYTRRNAYDRESKITSVYLRETGRGRGFALGFIAPADTWENYAAEYLAQEEAKRNRQQELYQDQYRQRQEAERLRELSLERGKLAPRLYKELKKWEESTPHQCALNRGDESAKTMAQLLRDYEVLDHAK